MAPVEQHPLPSPEEARERGKMRKAASDGAQAAIWVWFFVMLAAVVVLAAAWGLRHRLTPRAPDLQPSLPALPGQPPEPKSP